MCSGAALSHSLPQHLCAAVAVCGGDIVKWISSAIWLNLAIFCWIFANWSDYLHFVWPTWSYIPACGSDAKRLLGGGEGRNASNNLIWKWHWKTASYTCPWVTSGNLWIYFQCKWKTNIKKTTSMLKSLVVQTLERTWPSAREPACGREWSFSYWLSHFFVCKVLVVQHVAKICFLSL